MEVIEVLRFIYAKIKKKTKPLTFGNLTLQFYCVLFTVKLSKLIQLRGIPLTNVQSLTFEQRQIEGWSWWQNWPILCPLQLCCWVEDLNSNSLGSRPASTKI